MLEEIKNSEIVEKSTNEITQHNFDSQKEQLKKFADSVPKNIQLKKLESNQFWFLNFDTVKTSDVNEVTKGIQAALIEQNKNLQDVYKAFDTVYKTFNELDNNYIQRILVNLEAAREANRKAVQGLEENKKIVEQQQTIIEVLKKHKAELDELQHLKDIDIFFDEFKDFEATQEKTNVDLSSNQMKITEQFDKFHEECNSFISTHKLSLETLNSSQKNAEEQLEQLQNDQNDLSQTQNEILLRQTNIQEQLSQKVRYLQLGIILNFLAIIVLLVLIFSGVL